MSQPLDSEGATVLESEPTLSLGQLRRCPHPETTPGHSWIPKLFTIHVSLLYAQVNRAGALSPSSCAYYRVSPWDVEPRETLAQS